MAEDDSSYCEEDSNPGEMYPVNDAPKKMGDVEDPAAHVKYGTVVNVPLCSMLKRRVTELQECYIALYDTFVLYKVVGRYETPVDSDDLEGEWKEVKVNYRWMRMRKDISEVSMFYDNDEQLWGITVTWTGVGETSWYFEKGKDAKKLHDVLQNYFVSRP